MLYKIIFSIKPFSYTCAVTTAYCGSIYSYLGSLGSKATNRICWSTVQGAKASIYLDANGISSNYALMTYLLVCFGNVYTCIGYLRSAAIHRIYSIGCSTAQGYKSFKDLYANDKYSSNSTMRLCQPPDGSTSPKYKLLHF